MVGTRSSHPTLVPALVLPTRTRRVRNPSPVASADQTRFVTPGNSTHTSEDLDPNTPLIVMSNQPKASSSRIPIHSPGNPFTTEREHPRSQTTEPIAHPFATTATTAPTEDPLAQAIAQLSLVLERNQDRHSDRISGSVKARKPDPFDGNDSGKLNTFLVQLELNFKARPQDFPDDESKVVFAVTYLKGTALALVEPTILEGHTESWTDDYDEFVQLLQLNFGPHDPVGDAEAKLTNLRMRNNQRISEYTVQWNQYATRTGWDEAALRHRFYAGLPSRIKDEVARNGKPTSLTQLRTLAQIIDGRYWERQAELGRERNAANRAANNTSNSGNNNQRNNSGNSNGNSGQKNNKPAQTTASGSSGAKPVAAPSNNSNSGKPPAGTLNSKLGKDGQLTTQERERRFKNNLCMFCGKAGHTAKECNKASSSAAKARAAKAVDGTAPAAAPADSSAKN